MNKQEQQVSIDDVREFILGVQKDIQNGWMADAFVLKLARIALESLSRDPITLPRVSHPANFDYADKVAEALKAKGLKVVGYDDE